jgi:predicted ATPase
VARVLRGWALSEQGSADEALSGIRKGVDGYRITGAEASVPYLLSILAEANRRLGQSVEGLIVLNEALETAQRNGELHHQAEIYRLRGELALLDGNENAAEADFHQAIQVARRQGAKMLELRATTSMSRFWWERGKGEEARETLQEIYDWFTEGFDTPDLRKAKALLL